jgi:hypothetical protein
VVKTLVCFHEVLGSNFDGALNISLTNAIYKCLHHGEWHQKKFVDKFFKILKINSQHIVCHDMLWQKYNPCIPWFKKQSKKKVVWRHDILFHAIST